MATPIPAAVPFADHHMHLTSSEVAQRMREKLSPDILGGFIPTRRTAAEMVAVLDAARVKQGLAISNAYQWSMDFLETGPDEYDWVRFENDWAAAEAARYPNRLVPFLSIHPLKPYARTEIDRCVSELGYRGLKLHFTNSGVDLRQPEHLAQIQAILTHAESIQLPVVIHFLSRNPRFGAEDVTILLEQVLAGLPDLKVQMAHLGCGGRVQTTFEVFEAFIVAFEEHPELNKGRIFMDLAAVISDGSKPLTEALSAEQLDRITGLIRRWGVEQILWATDWPIFEPCEYIQMVSEKLRLDYRDLDILFANPGLFPYC